MLPVAPTAAPTAPSTVGFGEFVLIVTTLPAMGTAPPDQLLPTVQSLLVVPVQLWAEADAVNRAISAAAEALASSKRSIRVRLSVDRERCVRFRLLHSGSSWCRRIEAAPMHSRIRHSNCVRTVRGCGFMSSTKDNHDDRRAEMIGQ